MGWFSNWFSKLQRRDYAHEVSEQQMREFKRRLERAIENGFRLIYDPMTMQYVGGFDRDVRCELYRKEWEAPVIAKLSDFHPAFNVFGLYWRPLTSTEERV